MALEALRSTFKRSTSPAPPAAPMTRAPAATATWPAAPTYLAPGGEGDTELLGEAAEPYGLPSQPFTAPADRFTVPEAPTFGQPSQGVASSHATSSYGSSFAADQYSTVFADPITGGGTDGAAFACLECGRTLDHGTRRCEGCGQWLILDVPIRRTAKLSGAGAGAGILVTLLLVNLFAPAKQEAVPDPSLTGGASGAPAAVTVPSGALAALRGTTAINGRLVAEAGPLAKALGAKSFKTNEVVKILRRLAIDTRAGAGMIKPMTGWPEAAGQQAALAAFYTELERRIDGGLSSSVNSTRAYKKAAKAILSTLGSVPDLDADARALATQAGVALPVVAIPAAVR